MNAGTVLVVIGFALILGALITGIQIANSLRSRGMSANPLFVRWMIFRYLEQYKQATLKETGEVGPLYSRCTGLFAAGGILTVAGLLVPFR